MEQNLAEEYRDYPSLSEIEAQNRLIKEGFNELPSSKHRNLLDIALEVVKEPMLLLLIGCGTVYLFLGDKEEAALLIGSIFLIMGITFYQERKTERALDALKDLSSPRALVIRDGLPKKIPGREVARGDIVILSEGDRVPSDSILMSATNLTANESLLTGESVPARKIKWDGMLEPGRPGGDDLPFVYSGTLVTSGRGIARVFATGMNTEIGKIGKSLEGVGSGKTLLQKEIKSLVLKMSIWGGFLCALVVLAYSLIFQNWLNGLLAGLALAMSVIPEEFPVVLTIFLAMGAWRMSKKNVLARRVPVIETLGATTVLCVDKTGTLTMNQMMVNKIYASEKFLTVDDKTALPEHFGQLVETAALASQKDPFDPMEKAIRSLNAQKFPIADKVQRSWSLVRQYPLSEHLLAMSQIWLSDDRGEYLVAAKGAPEAIMDLCHLKPAIFKKHLLAVEKMADDGLRVLGVARAKINPVMIPTDQHDIQFEFLGLIGLADPVRPQAALAIEECYKAGIKVVMITGDYPGTAKKIGKEINMEKPDNILTGMELDEMDDDALEKQINDISIFARVVPEQKLRIVKAFQANGHIVAMTGDGVNDAPALKSADVGIAMGQRGTDVAREAAGLVLLDDNFVSIVTAVKEGRRIYENIVKAISYVFAIHIPITGMVLIPILLKWPLMLLPVHIVFLEMIVDPACSIVFEQEKPEKNIMNRPPRKLGATVLNRKLFVLSALQGVFSLLATLLVYWFVLDHTGLETKARAIAFITLVASNLSLILVNRSWTSNIVAIVRNRNNSFWYISLSVLIVLSIVIFLPSTAGLFKFGNVFAHEFFLAVLIGIASVAWFEIFKLSKKQNRV